MPRDAELPHLAQALDEDCMAAEFARQLPGLQVRGCELERVKYRPARNCTVAYGLRLHNPQLQHSFEQRVAVRFCSAAEAARRYAKGSARRLQASTAGPALTYKPEWGMVATWWPNDAKLEAPRLLVDSAELRRRCLGEVVHALTAGRARLLEHHTTIVQAVPEQRVCARVELRLQALEGGAQQTQTLYAKASLGRDGAQTHAAMQALSDSAAQASGLLRTPRSLLWQADAGLHWQLGLPGRVLEEVDPQLQAATSACVGRHLAALHRTAVPGAERLDVHALRAQLRQAVELLERVEPTWQPVLQRLAQRLDSGASALAGEPAATLHGDLHTYNILVDGDRVGDSTGDQLAFIDLDSMRCGPAAVELGGWVADLQHRALLAGGAPWQLAQAAQTAQAFLNAYVQAQGRAVPMALLAWGAAHHLLCKRAYRGVANLKPGRFEAVPQLLALADAILSAGHIDGLQQTAEALA